MAAQTYAQIQGTKALNDLFQQFMQTFLSGQNVDASAFTLPVSGAPVVPNVAGNASGTAITATSANQANAIGTATLTGVAAKTTYITGFTCTASGATSGLPVIVTVAGLVTGTMNYIFTFPAGVLVPATPLVVTFPTPIPSSAVNTNIVITLPASGAGGTNATVNATGFLL